MKELNILIGQNLKSVRKSQNLSLDEAAALTGVSKPMLGQIERGKSNPTVTTLWKIAAGFKVPFSEFMKEPKLSYQFVSPLDLEPIMECDEKMKIFTMFSYNDNFEILYVDLEPGCIHISPKHPNEVEEYIFVMEGILRVKIGKKSMILKKGEALKFRANVEHEYANLENVKCRFQNINVYYKN
ncbi:MAG: DNA-binding protein [Fusobacteriia bacterium 4572_74]|nr:MAG: DNA-binding protein [Fusobacteriia bacterium 4572_74]